ncbi:MAG: hypothetical protein K5739_01650 [Lachnospiraceae bacterium]|nr:hypothetical protein [Lachnospiraceae bacterium]
MAGKRGKFKQGLALSLIISMSMQTVLTPMPAIAGEDALPSSAIEENAESVKAASVSDNAAPDLSNEEGDSEEKSLQTPGAGKTEAKEEKQDPVKDEAGKDQGKNTPRENGPEDSTDGVVTEEPDDASDPSDAEEAAESAKAKKDSDDKMIVTSDDLPMGFDWIPEIGTQLLSYHGVDLLDDIGKSVRVAEGYPQNLVRLEFATSPDGSFESTPLLTSGGDGMEFAYVRIAGSAYEGFTGGHTDAKKVNVRYLNLEDCTPVGEIDGGKTYIGVEGISQVYECDDGYSNYLVYAKDSITLKAPDDFLFRPNVGGMTEFVDSLTLDRDTDSIIARYDAAGPDRYYVNYDTEFKLKRLTDGAETKEYPYLLDLPSGTNVIFDNEKPEISTDIMVTLEPLDSLDIDHFVTPAETGDDVEGWKVRIPVSDANLDPEKITVTSDLEYDIKEVEAGDDRKQYVTIYAQYGPAKEVKIEAYDKAGNSSAMMLYVHTPRQERSGITVSVPKTMTAKKDLTYTPALSSDTEASLAEYTYKKQGEDDSQYSSSQPTAAGKYVIKASLPQTSDYRAYSCTFEYELVRDVPEFLVTIPDSTYGKAVSPVVTTNSDFDKEKIEYRFKNTKIPTDDAYTTVMPTAAGEYAFVAMMGETDYFEQSSCDGSFTIQKVSVGNTKVEVPDTYVGTSYEPVLTTDSDAAGQVTYLYKPVDADESSYSGQKPAKAGNYIVKAQLPETENSEAITVTDTFTIKKQKATLSVSLSEVYAGVDYHPVINTNSDNADAASLLYKPKDVEGAAFTVVRPNQPGKYVLQVTIPASDAYEQISTETDFIVSYLDQPGQPYLIRGEKGKNDFYVSDVYLAAPDGFEIAASEFPESWQKEIAYGDQQGKIYLKRTGDGALTAAISVKELLIDQKAPVIKSAKDEDGEAVTLTNKKTIHADRVEVKISDAYLYKVTLNGDSISFKGETASLTLEPEEGDSKDFMIVAKDKAGNTLKMECTVVSAWEKKGIVPSGKKLKLKSGKAYKLKEGKWKISGDSTVYSGGATFYVGSEGEYTFTQE